MFTIDEIKSLMDKMKETNLGKLKIDDGGFLLKIEAKEQTVITAPAVQVAPTETISTYSYESIEKSTAPITQEVCGNVVKSPIVGTFYASAAPDKPPFVTVGKRVQKGDVLFVIESMKLMNEIQSEFDGEIIEINVSNAQGVEYNQPIMVIK